MNNTWVSSWHTHKDNLTGLYITKKWLRLLWRPGNWYSNQSDMAPLSAAYNNTHHVCLTIFTRQVLLVIHKLYRLHCCLLPYIQWQMKLVIRMEVHVNRMRSHWIHCSCQSTAIKNCEWLPHQQQTVSGSLEKSKPKTDLSAAELLTCSAKKSSCTHFSKKNLLSVVV